MSAWLLRPCLVLRRFLEEQEEIPWAALSYVTGQINYGGRVTDDSDRRCLMAVLSTYMTPDILDDTYRFSRSGNYYAPRVGSYSDMMDYLEALPVTGGYFACKIPWTEGNFSRYMCPLEIFTMLFRLWLISAHRVLLFFLLLCCALCQMTRRCLECTKTPT